jgi:hypothetical protein
MTPLLKKKERKKKRKKEHALQLPICLGVYIKRADK